MLFYYVWKGTPFRTQKPGGIFFLPFGKVFNDFNNQIDQNTNCLENRL